MLKKYFALLTASFLLSLTSCDLVTSLPSSVYLQNQTPVAKPIYKGADTSMIRISGGYSMLDIEYSEGTWTDNVGDTVWNSENNRQGSWIQTGLVEIDYGRSLEKLSYGFGVIGALGQFNEVFTELGRGVRSYKTGAIGGKANVSFDVNKDHLTMRAVQLQVGVSHDFGEYADSRFAIADGYPSFASVPYLIPPNTTMGNFAISHKSELYFDDFSFAIGGGFALSTALSEGFDPSFNSFSGTVLLEFGYRNFDLFMNYSETVAPYPIATNFQAGLGYSFGWK